MKSCDELVCDELVREIASEIVNSKHYINMDWDSVSVVVCFDSPSIWMQGILYLAGDYVTKNPTSLALTDKLIDLRNLMSKEDGGEWVVCLIKISALTQEIEVDFEYEDKKRWYLTPTMDPAELRAYAMSIK